MYAMHKTTVFIPKDVKRALEELAAARGVSEAELIREALRTMTREARPPRPRIPLFKSGVSGGINVRHFGVERFWGSDGARML